MPVTTPEHRAELDRLGKFGDFVRRRDELKAGGMGSTDAHRTALVEMLPGVEMAPVRPNNEGKHWIPGVPSGLSPSVARRMGIELPDGKGKCRDKVAKETVSVDSKPKAKRGGTRKRVVADGGNGSPGADDEQGVIEPSSGVPGVGVTGVGGPVPLPAMDITDLGGRTGSEVEIVRWVARNMEMLSPDVDGCPDATAWGLLAHCRRSELARAEFWKQTYPKLLPSKAQLETTVEVDMDGSGTVELIGRIRAMRESAEGDGT